MASELRIHIDQLEYTREGLRTREPLGLTVGDINQIVLIRPKPVRSVPVGYGCFGHDSAFPTPGVLMLGLRVALESLSELLGGNTGGILQFFGHAEASGDEAYNKTLSEERADMVRALFVRDVDTVKAMAEDQGWDTWHWQVMLRVLRCDPGPIDGESGVLTEFAVGLFQREYNEGVFHRHLELPPPPPLVEDSVLGPMTEAALIEAFVNATSPNLDPERLHPTHPVAGCSEFNRVGPEPSVHDRRVSLVVHPHLPPFHDQAPCTRGDHGVCPAEDDEGVPRCLWYRAHVVDPPVEELVHRHFDLRWLPLPNGKILLSALTTLTDEDTVLFQVFRTAPIEGPEHIRPDQLGAPLGEAIEGVVRGGVAQAIWEPPEGVDVFSVRQSLVPRSLDDIDPFRPHVPQARVPVFRVAGGGVEALSPPPGRELGRVPRAPANSPEPSPVGFAAVDAFGRFYQHATHSEERNLAQLHPLRDDEPRVLLARHANVTIEGARA